MNPESRVAPRTRWSGILNLGLPGGAPTLVEPRRKMFFGIFRQSERQPGVAVGVWTRFGLVPYDDHRLWKTTCK